MAFIEASSLLWRLTSKGRQSLTTPKLRACQW